jgi:predicted amidophosphoribosyltransferase
MATVKMNPTKLPGVWTDGYALESQHTLSSQFLGYDSFGNPQFDTRRSELGELVFRLKNRNDKDTLESIADTAVQFIEGWNPSFDLIVPMPPSRKRLEYQPVVEIANAIGERLSKVVNSTALTKVKETDELKNVFDYQQRINLLEGAFNVDFEAVRGKRILLVDDLFRSGATATVATQHLLRNGAAAVYVLAVTKTRTRI